MYETNLDQGGAWGVVTTCLAAVSLEVNVERHTAIGSVTLRSTKLGIVAVETDETHVAVSTVGRVQVLKSICIA